MQTNRKPRPEPEPPEQPFGDPEGFTSEPASIAATEAPAAEGDPEEVILPPEPTVHLAPPLRDRHTPGTLLSVYGVGPLIAINPDFSIECPVSLESFFRDRGWS